MDNRQTTRYAIYFTPDRASALWRFGCAVIGYDAASGRDVSGPDHATLSSELLPRYRHEPARYGFHATLKAPFELVAGTECTDLLKAVRELAAQQRFISIANLAVSRMGSFLALTPGQTPPELIALAGTCVRQLDRFRAPLSDADRSRRLKVGLTTRQRANLERWGYPYVFEDFRFHLTLTGAMPPAVQEAVAPALQDLYVRIAGPITIDSISVLVQAGNSSRFRILERFLFPAS